MVFLANKKKPYDQTDCSFIRIVGKTAWLMHTQVNRENELHRSKDSIHQTALAKSRFFAAMSHEIRTPLNGILGMADILMNSVTSEEQKEYISILRDSSNTLIAIINDILDISRIESGRIDIEISRFQTVKFIDTVIKFLKPLAQAKGIHIHYEIKPLAPEFIISDMHRLRQIIVNLLGNAIKFTDEGYCSLSVTSHDGTGKEPLLLFAIKDTGPGIDPDRQQRIFEPYAQADASVARKYGGSGLGLAISKQLVHLLGGTLWLESEPGKGSTFFFTIQLKDISESGDIIHLEPNIDIEKNSQASHTILLVEDNRVNQFVAHKMLEKLGHTVITAQNGEEAISRLHQHEVDLILMDIEMPVMDGLTAATIIRSKNHGHNRSSIPIIALTAHAQKADRERFLELGMDDYLAKPISTDELRIVINRVMGNNAEKKL